MRIRIKAMSIEDAVAQFIRKKIEAEAAEATSSNAEQEKEETTEEE